MDFFWQTPIILKVLLVFALILFLMRRKYNLGLALLAGAICLGVWCQMTPLMILRSFGVALRLPKTLLISLVAALIMLLSRAMEQFGQMKRLLDVFQDVVKNEKLKLVIFPALIGLLPMPGGAIFSAPMVEEFGKRHQLDAESKSLINYWFRHVWETAWPLYPGFLLASTLAGVNPWLFASRSCVLSFGSMLCGYWFFLRPIPLAGDVATTPTPRVDWGKLAHEIFPIVFVIMGAVGGSFAVAGLTRLWPAAAKIPPEIALIGALLVSIFAVIRRNHAPLAHVRLMLVERPLLRMIFMIVAIFLFKQILEDSRAVLELSKFLIAQQIPFVIVLIILPFLAGSLSGIAVGFVGTSFPVLISLFQTLHIDPAFLLPHLMLAYCAGFVGMMLSPLHVCLVFTHEYFHADVPTVYRRLGLPLLTLLLIGLAYFRVWVWTLT